MLKVEGIDKVSQIALMNDTLLAGVNSNAKKGSLVSHGDKIVLYRFGQIIEEFNQKYFHFIPYCDGILYYESEGGPIFFTDFKDKEQFTPPKHYFNPLQLRSNRNSVVIAEMDEVFNKFHYLYSRDSARKSLPNFPSLLLAKHFLYTSRNLVELYRTDSMKKCWEYQLGTNVQFDKSA